MNILRQLPLDLRVKVNYSETSFIQGPCNQAALTLVQQWPNWPGRFASIYGETGSGKTHLAHIWQNYSQALYLTPKDIGTESPRDTAKNFQAFILDDGEKVTNQTWLFDFYNILKEKNAYLLICSLIAPTRWPLTLPDLRSRLSTIIAVEVTPPDDMTLEGVMSKAFADRGIEANSDVIRYILRRADRSFREIHHLIDILDHHALAQGRPLTINLVREVLEESD